ncbi:MAG: class I SAM-dependent methyltransferase [Bacteroidota bacterium]
MKEMWEARFREEGFAYGSAPNEFFQRQIDPLPPEGKLLMGAEGEGRNAVYAATRGWEVHAFDIAQSARKKAEDLAASAGVTLDYRVGELPDLGYTPESFAVIGLVYAHFPPPILSSYHQILAGLLRPGGHLILEAFSTTHLPFRAANPAVGGPNRLDMLLDEAMIRTDFAGIEPLLLEDAKVTLAEGKFHNGTGKVLRFVGRKPMP